MAGIYIHIPFCRKKCSYCDFHFSTNFSAYRSQMIDVIADELNDRLIELESEEINTIYFGGGTPSILNRDEFDKILSGIAQKVELKNLQEITLEANPEDITERSLKEWKKLGFNRLSIGVQSFKQSDLDWMNRAHSLDESRNSIFLAKKAGFDNISLDLMYGLPNLSVEEWNCHLEEVLSFGVNHISAYCLTVEDKTKLKKQISQGVLELPDEKMVIEQFNLLIQKLSAADFVQYEISNFGLGNYRAVHNSSYWKREKYIGIGPSAHSFNGIQRRWNISNNTSYIKQQNWFEVETLSENEKWNEFILTGLRTMEGIDIEHVKREFSLDNNFFKTKLKFLELNWVNENDNKITLSAEGKLRADYIASEFFRV